MQSKDNIVGRDTDTHHRQGNNLSWLFGGRCDNGNSSKVLLETHESYYQSPALQYRNRTIFKGVFRTDNSLFTAVVICGR